LGRGIGKNKWKELGGKGTKWEGKGEEKGGKWRRGRRAMEIGRVCIIGFRGDRGP